MDQKSGTMTAWTHVQAGLPREILKLRKDVPIPKITSPTQVRVKITHAALNPGPSIIMQFAPTIFRTKPCVPEMDFAGVIESAGTDVPAALRSPGTEVFGSILVSGHMSGAGALAEYVVADTQANSTVLVMPRNGVDANQASGLAIAGATALALVEKAKLDKGIRVLINGAAGGIGIFTTQLVRSAIGDQGHILAICSTAHKKAVMEAGANEVLDRQLQSPVEDHLKNSCKDRKFDVVIDAFGSSYLFSHCPSFLEQRGCFVTVGVAFDMTLLGLISAVFRMAMNSSWPLVLGGTPRKYIQVTATANLPQLEKLRDLCVDGKLRVFIDSTWRMEEVLEAYQKLSSRSVQGKLIVDIDSLRGK